MLVMLSLIQHYNPFPFHALPVCWRVLQPCGALWCRIHLSGPSPPSDRGHLEVPSPPPSHRRSFEWPEEHYKQQKLHYRRALSLLGSRATRLGLMCFWSDHYCQFVPDEDVLLLPYSLAQRLSEGHLSKVLQRGVDGIPDRLVKHRLHSAHQNLHRSLHSNMIIVVILVVGATDHQLAMKGITSNGKYVCSPSCRD